jgi:hypothetical protein
MLDPNETGMNHERLNLEEFKALITGLVAEQHDLNEGLTLQEVQDITGLAPADVQTRLVKIRADLKAAQPPPFVSAPTPARPMFSDPYGVTPTFSAPPPMAQAPEETEGFDYSKSLDPNVQPEEFPPQYGTGEQDYSDPIDPAPFLDPDQPSPKIPRNVVDPMTGQTTAGIEEPFDYTRSLDPNVEPEDPSLDDMLLDGARENGETVLKLFLVLAVCFVFLIFIFAMAHS